MRWIQDIDRQDAKIDNINAVRKAKGLDPLLTGRPFKIYGTERQIKAINNAVEVKKNNKLKQMVENTKQ